MFEVPMPAPAQQEFERDRDVVGLVVGDRLRAAHQRADIQMVLQVRADGSIVHFDANALRAQLFGRADARQHQQLRRIQRAAAQDDLRALGALKAAVTAIFDTDGASVREQHAFGGRVRDHREVLSLARRLRDNPERSSSARHSSA